MGVCIFIFKWDSLEFWCVRRKAGPGQISGRIKIFAQRADAGSLCVKLDVWRDDWDIRCTDSTRYDGCTISFIKQSTRARKSATRLPVFLIWFEYQPIAIEELHIIKWSKHPKGLFPKDSISTASKISTISWDMGIHYQNFLPCINLS